MARFRSRPRFARTGVRRRAPVAWVRDQFDIANAVDYSGAQAIAEYSILERDDWQPSTTTIASKCSVKRIIVDAVLQQRYLANGVGYIQAPISMFWALYVIEEDDTDATLLTAAQGSILGSNRVLRYGALSDYLVSPLNFVANGSSQPHRGDRIHIDMRPGLVLRPGYFLVFGIQLSQPVATDISGYGSMQLTMASSVLVSVKS